MKKCYVSDPDTNQGTPVELTANNLRPYYEEQRIVGRIPASDFALHIFGEKEILPFSVSHEQEAQASNPNLRFIVENELIPLIYLISMTIILSITILEVSTRYRILQQLTNLHQKWKINLHNQSGLLFELIHSNTSNEYL